ncbi:MAG TPA: hypothetical protein VGD31_08110 [Sphingobacteriaceae bacterium]
MKLELKIPQNEIQVEPDKNLQPLRKRWLVGKKDHKVENQLVEHCYNDVLNEAKALFTALPDESSKTVFEKNYRYDNSENSFAMHSFITSSFYWYLECHFAYYYHVEFDFYNCPFEEQLRTSFERKFAYTNNRCSQRHLEPNCEEYWKRVLEIQDKKYMHVL